MRNVVLVELYIFCSAILLLVLNQLRVSLQQLPEERIFKKIVISLLVLLLADTIEKTSFFDDFLGNQGKNVLLSFSCMVSMFVPYLWNIFVNYKVHGSIYYFRKYLIPFSIPLAIGSMLCIIDIARALSSQNSSAFIKPNIVVHIINALYLVAASVQCFISAKKNYTKTGRLFELYLSKIMIVPILAIIMQLVTSAYNIPIITPVFTIVFLHIYISQQYTLITIDHLTNLNNERRLNTYLHNKTYNLAAGQRLFILIITLDNMKIIQKKYGRKISEKIIVDFSSFLRSCTTENKLFLARYQKDSFAITLEKKSWDEVESFCKNLIHKSTLSPLLTSGFPVPITFSIYFSEFGQQGINNVIDFLENTKNHCYKPSTPLSKER